MIAGEIEIRLLADIARLQRDMNRANQLVSNATASMERAANAAKAALGGITTGLSGGEIIRMADEYTKFTAQLKLATQSQREYAQAYAAVKSIASASQQDLGATGVLYARIANGTRELGQAQKQVAAITETVNLALKVSGAAASESASAQLQLSQAFASGRLNGEEFNAVNEAAPRLMKALADGMGVPVGALKKMAEEGRITSAVMADVLPKALAELREEAKQVQTIGGAFTELKSNIMEFTGVQAQSSGAVSALTGAISGLANNLDTVAKIGGVVAAVYGGRVVAGLLAAANAKMDDIIASRAQARANEEAAAAALRRAQAERQTALIAQSKARETTAMVRAEVAADQQRVASAARAAEQQIITRQGQFAATAAIVRQEIALEQTRLAAQINSIGRAQRTAELARLATQLAAIEKGMAAQSAALAAQRIANEQAVANAAAAGAARIAAAREAEVIATGAAAAATLRMRAANAALTSAMGATAVASRALTGALALVGGPIGLITLALTVGATVWTMWGNKAEEANDKALQSAEETTPEMIARLDKQIEKLKERNALAATEPRIKGLNELSEADRDGLARAKAALDANRELQSVVGDRPKMMLQLEEIDLLANYETALNRVQQVQDQVAIAAARTRDQDIAAWYAQNGSNAQRLAAELDELKKKFGSIPPEMEKIVRAKYADKGAAAAINQEATAYQNLMTSIREKIAANQLELQGYDELSESQKMTVKLDAAIGTGKNKLSAEHVKEARALIEQVRVQEASIKSKAQAAEFEKNYAESLGMTARLLDDRVKDAEAEAARNEELARTYGMSKAAIEAEELARLESQLAQRNSLGLTEKEVETLEKLITARKRNVAAIGAMEQVDAANKAREEWQRAAESIEQSLTDALLRGFESGKSFGRNLIDTLKNMFSTLVLRPIIQPMMAPVSGSLASMVPGSAQAAGVPTGGGSMSSMLANGYAFLNGSMINYGATKGVTTVANWMMDSSSPMLQNMGASLGNNAGMISSGLGMLGNGMAGYGLSKGLSGGYSAGNWVNIAAGIASAIPGIGPIAGVVGALVNRAFGRKAKEITGTTLNGTFGANGFAGTTDSAWKQEGGWFRSDKRGVDKVAIDAAMAKQFTDGYEAIKAASADYAQVLGISADAIKNRVQAMSVALGKDEEANEKAIADFFVGVGNAIAVELLPSLTAFQKEGEEASATLQRLATDYATVDAVLTSIGMTFGAVGTASLSARERLIEAAGGLEAFAANTAGFQQNFLSESERNAPVLKSVTEQLAALGLAGVDTRDEFKQVVLGLDLTTEAGAKQYGSLMKLQAAFAQVYPAMEDAAAVAKAAADALAQTNKGYQDQIDEILKSRMSAEEVRAIEIAGMDASTVALYDRLAGLKAEAAALDAQAEAQRVATQAAKDRGADLLSGVDSAFSALQSVANREKALLQESANAHRALSTALRGTLDGMRVAGQEQEDRLGAQAQIRAALAMAKATGVLPDADSLKSALSVVGKDSAALFSTQEEYLRDFYSTQSDIADLAGLTDKALTAEEESLKRLDGILSSAQQQIDALKGIDTSIFSLAEAISGFDRAIEAAKADPVASAGRELSKAYKELLGRQIDSAGLKFYSDRMAEGVTIEQVRAAIKQSEEYKKLKGVPGFANGGDFGGGLRLVGEVGPELEVTGPSRIHSTRDLMASLRSPSEGNAALVAEVRTLRSRLDALFPVLYQVAKNTGRGASSLENLDRTGVEIREGVPV